MRCPCTIVSYTVGKKRPRSVTRHYTPLQLARWEKRRSETSFATMVPCQGKVEPYGTFYDFRCTNYIPGVPVNDRDIDLTEPAEVRAIYKHLGMDEIDGATARTYYSVTTLRDSVLKHVEWEDLLYDFVGDALWTGDVEGELALVKKREQDMKAWETLLGGPQKTLFARCNPAKIRAVFSELLTLRNQHPGYRDDELLMFMMARYK